MMDFASNETRTSTSKVKLYAHTHIAVGSGENSDGGRPSLTHVSDGADVFILGPSSCHDFVADTLFVFGPGAFRDETDIAWLLFLRAITENMGRAQRGDISIYTIHTTRPSMYYSILLLARLYEICMLRFA
jgi:hypothetical protein